jgi:hypothetical protein
MTPSPRAIRVLAFAGSDATGNSGFAAFSAAEAGRTAAPWRPASGLGER